VATVPPTRYAGTGLVVDHLERGLVVGGHHVTLFTTGDSTCPVGPVAPVTTSVRGSAPAGNVEGSELDATKYYIYVTVAMRGANGKVTT